MVDWASRRACELILKHAGGELIDGVIDVGPTRPARTPITLRLPQLKRIIGIDIPPAAVRKILSALGCAEPSADAAQIITIPPSWRRDLEREIDLVEEVARIHGYDKIPEDASVPMAASHRPDSDRVLGKVRAVLTAAGFDEAMTASVVPQRWSEAFSPWTNSAPLVANTPMLEGADRLRRSLVPSLLEARRLNESLNNPTIELFETARTYFPTDSLPREQPTLAAVSGRGFLQLRGVVESLLESLHIAQPLEVANFSDELLAAGEAIELKLAGERLGFLGVVSPVAMKSFALRNPAAILEIDLSALSVRAKLIPKYKPQSPYPTIARDLNLIVAESVRWSNLASTVRSAAGAALERLEYLDTYCDPKKDGPDTKRLHFSFTLRAADRTLTGPEADAIRDAIIAACQKQHGAKLLT
jgi:phenylalanyl-tRNA synthetase beta chain